MLNLCGNRKNIKLTSRQCCLSVYREKRIIKVKKMPEVYSTIGGKLFLLIFAIAIISGFWSSSVDSKREKIIVSIGWKFAVSFLAVHITLSTFKIVNPWDVDLAVYISIFVAIPITIAIIIVQLKDNENKKNL